MNLIAFDRNDKANAESAKEKSKTMTTKQYMENRREEIESKANLINFYF